MSDTQEKELKPCPFCDEPPKLQKSWAAHTWIFRVFCEHCACCHRYVPTEAEAIAAWNTRSSETAAEVERLRAIVSKLPLGEDGHRIAPGMTVDAKDCSGMHVEAVYANGEVFCSHRKLVQHSDMFDANQLRLSASSRAAALSSMKSPTAGPIAKEDK